MWLRRFSWVCCSALFWALLLCAVSAGAATPILENPVIPLPQAGYGPLPFIEPIQNIEIEGLGVRVPIQLYSFTDNSYAGWPSVMAFSPSLTATEWVGVFIQQEVFIGQSPDPAYWVGLKANGSLPWVSLGNNGSPSVNGVTGAPMPTWLGHSKETERKLLVLYHGAKDQQGRYRVSWRTIWALRRNQNLTQNKTGVYDQSFAARMDYQFLDTTHMPLYYDGNGSLNTQSWYAPRCLVATGGGWSTDPKAIGAIAKSIEATSIPWIDKGGDPGDTNPGGVDIPDSLDDFKNDVQAKLNLFAAFWQNLLWPFSTFASVPE